jgi:MFS family permease
MTFPKDLPSYDSSSTSALPRPREILEILHILPQPLDPHQKKNSHRLTFNKPRMSSIASKPFKWLYHMTGLSSVVATGIDAWLIIITRSFRMFAYGFNALIMALFFEELGYPDDMMGVFFTMTLLGDVLLSLVLTLVADGLGRRRILFAGSALMVLSGAAFALSENYWVLLAAAVLGVISPSGSEIGPFRAVEESTLSHLTVPETRAEVLTWYIVTATVGTSAGLVFCGNLVDKLQSKGWTAKESYHVLFWIYSACGVANMILTLFLSRKCEADSHSSQQKYQQVPQEEEQETRSSAQTHDRRPSTIPLIASQKKKSKFAQISKESRPVLYKLCTIMSLDSLASGMAAYSLINLYLDRKFGLPKGKLGDIMSVTWFISAFMNMWAGAIAKRIGLIKTMVFTHLPSAIFLGLLPAPTSLGPTIALLFARASLNSMDQAPRSAFIAAVVKPEERTAVMGIVNVLKILAQSAGPSITGVLASKGLFWLAFAMAGGLKVSYDLGLLAMFVNTQLHKHEQPKAASDEEDVYTIVDDEDEDSEDESEGAGSRKGNDGGEGINDDLDGALRKDIRPPRRPASLRKSFSFPSKEVSHGKIGEDDSAASSEVDLSKGHKRSESFPLKDVS